MPSVQTINLCASLPKCKSLFEKFDSAPAVWRIVRVPIQVPLSEFCAAYMEKNNLKISFAILGEQRNEFSSRTAALRQSCYNAKGIGSATEKGHWGVWQVVTAKGSQFWQFILPFAPGVVDNSPTAKVPTIEPAAVPKVKAQKPVPASPVASKPNSPKGTSRADRDKAAKIAQAEAIQSKMREAQEAALIGSQPAANPQVEVSEPAAE